MVHEHREAGYDIGRSAGQYERSVPTNGLVVIYGRMPRIVTNAEVITDGQNRKPQFGDSTADRIKTLGWDIGSTQDQPGEAQENMPPPESD